MGGWRKVAGIFGGDRPANASSENAFVELAFSVIRSNPDVLRADPEMGDGMSVLVRRWSGAEHKLFLRNTFLETREASPEEKRLRISNLVGFLDNTSRVRPWSEAMPALVPLLRVSTFAQDQGLGQLSSIGTLLVSRAFARGLRVRGAT